MIMNKKDVIYIKGVTIVLMVLHHLFAYKPLESYTSILPFFIVSGCTIEKIVGLFGKIVVTTYLFLSGYGMAHKTDKKFSFKDCIKQGWKLYKLYLLVFFIFVPWRYIINDSTFSIKEFLLNLIGYYSTFNAEWWFFSIYIIFILLIPVISKVSIKYLPFVSLGVMYFGYGIRFILTRRTDNIMIINFLNGQEWFILYNLLVCQFAFCLGYWMAKEASIFEKISSLLINMKLQIVILLGLALVILKWKIHGGYMLDTLLVPIYISVVMSIIYRSNLLERVFNFLGKCSTWIWLTHTFFCYYYFGKFIYSLKYSVFIFGMTMFSSLVASIILEFIHNKLQEKISKYSFSNKINKYLYTRG